MKIFVYDEFHPEDNAMLQALYSRSSASVEEHAKKVRETGSGKFMEKYYVGYGHLSIADCGSTTIFIEGISMLAAKAIQDWPLYSGQETSTRYIDFSKQEILDPVQTKTSEALHKNWLQFYTSSKESLIAHLKGLYPRKEGEDEKIYQKAIEARSFDILRGFLPAGATTQISWHTNLRQAYDKLALLRHHPLEEVRSVAEKILKHLQKRYEHSFSHKLYPEQEEYRAWLMQQYNYFNPTRFPKKFSVKTNIDPKDLKQYKDIFKKRPIKTNLPYFLSSLGTVTFDFLLDFGSFRDIQRHRSSIHRIPLLTTRFGANTWYLDQLPKQLRAKAEKLLDSQTKKINSLKVPDEEKQYYIPMIFNVPCEFTFALPAAVYTIELRSSKHVHPSLRKVALEMSSALENLFPEIVLHSERDPDDWDIRRGTQDIKEK